MIQAQVCQPYFKQFAQGWPIEEFLKLQLKNRCMYAQEHGFLEDIASLNIPAGGLQEEEEQEEDEINEGSNVGLYYPIMVRYLFV